MEQYLKSKQYYKDRYDQLTVDYCRNLEKNYKSSLKKKTENLLRDEGKAFVTVFNVMMYYETGEQYVQKEETIKSWMERDQERDDKLARATDPNAVCAKCNLEMECISRDLHNIDNQDQILFFFTCPSCKSHRAFFDNGQEYKPSPRLCPKCQKEITVKDSRKEKIITSIYSCANCDYKKKETFDLSVKNLKEKSDPNFEKDKARFCLSEKEGGEYIQGKYNLKQLTAMREKDEERKKNKELYDAVANIKKMTVQELQKLLLPILLRNNYVKLNFVQPRIEKQVIVDFTVQDSKSERDEYDSERQLGKVINKSLGNVNWRLMSNGISYRLGILSGSLKGFETEDDLVKLVQNRNKKKQ